MAALVLVVGARRGCACVELREGLGQPRSWIFVVLQQREVCRVRLRTERAELESIGYLAQLTDLCMYP